MPFCAYFFVTSVQCGQLFSSATSWFSLAQFLKEFLKKLAWTCYMSDFNRVDSPSLRQ